MYFIIIGPVLALTAKTNIMCLKNVSSHECERFSRNKRNIEKSRLPASRGVPVELREDHFLPPTA